MAFPATNSDDCAKGVERAARIFAEHGDFIHTVIRSGVKDDAQTDDLFQDFFLSLVSRPVPDNVRNLRSYLYRMITNDVVDAARRVKQYQARMYRYVEHLRYTKGNGDPEKALIRAEERNRLFELIEKRLRSSEAQAIVFRYKKDFSIQETANQMGINSRSVSKYLYKGLKKIRQLLKVR